MIQLIVSPDRPKGWTLKADFGETGYTEDFRTKFFAVRHAVSLAKELVRDRPLTTVSLMIQRRDGRWQEERTYPRSRDPRRSKG